MQHPALRSGEQLQSEECLMLQTLRTRGHCLRFIGKMMERSQVSPSRGCDATASQARRRWFIAAWSSHVSHKRIHNVVYAHPKGELREAFLLACRRGACNTRRPGSASQDTRGEFPEMVSIMSVCQKSNHRLTTAVHALEDPNITEFQLNTTPCETLNWHTPIHFRRVVSQTNFNRNGATIR
jgi:hypothetical protein